MLDGMGGKGYLRVEDPVPGLKKLRDNGGKILILLGLFC